MNLGILIMKGFWMLKTPLRDSLRSLCQGQSQGPEGHNPGINQNRVANVATAANIRCS